MREPAEWTEGVCEDGAAILRDGQMVPISDILAHLNACETLGVALDRLQSASRRLTDNINEFGQVTDDVFLDDVLRAGIAARSALAKASGVSP